MNFSNVDECFAIEDDLVCLVTCLFVYDVSIDGVVADGVDLDPGDLFIKFYIATIHQACQLVHLVLIYTHEVLQFTLERVNLFNSD